MKAFWYIILLIFVGLMILATLVFNSVERIDSNTDCVNLSLTCETKL